MLKTSFDQKIMSHIVMPAFFGALLLSPLTQVKAQENIVIDIPAQTQVTEITEIDGITHTPIRITPDKSELIRLEQDAGSIIIGNPLHVNVIADSSRTLVIVPRSPGATHFTVLNKKGEIIMQRHIIVASPKKDYVRVKRTCREDAENCQKTSVFYCPDMCHEIGLASQDGDSSGKSSASESSQDNAGAEDNISDIGQ